jgi:multiple sugar transport system ATP-binding protein
MAGVVFENVGKTYADGTEAVRSFSLDIPDGCLMVFVGPSGCGKTTALRMVAGLEEISSGVISIGGRVVNRLEPQDRDCAMVFQSYALYPHMSVYKNMAFSLKLRKMSKLDIDARVRETAGMLGLADMLGKRPRQLSGGQRQRVAMGRAIVREPQVFLMDEPLSNLDAKLRVQMRTEISRLQRRLGITTIYVTHDQIEATTMGDLVAVMRGGELLQVAPPKTLYDDPANVFVAGFIGSPGMNLTEAAVARDGLDLFVMFGEHRLRLPPALVEARPAIEGYEGRKVIVGLRPESLQDASLQSSRSGDRISVVVDVREDLGSELLAHFPVKSAPVTVEETGDGVAQLGDSRTTEFIARMSAQSNVREGQRTELWVDTQRIHLFDAATGAGIYHPLPAATPEVTVEPGRSRRLSA